MYGLWESDLALLLELGKILDRRSRRYRVTVRRLLIYLLLHIRDKNGALVRLRPNRVQEEFDRCHRRRSIVLKARQMGVTTWIAARFFVNTITRPGTVTMQVAHNQDSAEEIFRIVHRFLANLPEWLRKGALETSRANVRQLVFTRLDSEYRVDSAADVNAGRGLTIRNLHCSEVARWPGDPAATLAALRAAVPPGSEIVLESTPNGAGGCFYDEWQRADDRGYGRHFFPWWWAKEYAAESLRPTVDGVRPTEEPRAAAVGGEPSSGGLFTEDERALIRDHGLSAGQIAFRRELRATFGPLAPQEYAEDAESCFLASGECVFDIEIVQKRLAELCSARAQPAGPTASCRRRDEVGATIEAEPVLSEASYSSPAAAGCRRNSRQDAGATVEVTAEVAECRDNGRLLIFWPPRPTADYIIGADPAGGGTDGDFSCAQVIERITGLHCAELHGHFPPQEFAARLAALAREYNGALLAVERNNHGHAVLAHLANAEGYDNLYVQRGQAGWLTTVASRPAMLERFAALLRQGANLFGSARLLRECRSFVRKPDGAPSAASGAHDDTIMAMAIALAVREEMAGSARKEHAVEFSSMVR